MSLLNPSMEELPVEFIVDIISRLPVKMITQCKYVCKKWLNIVLDSYFADLQLSRSPAGFMISHNYKLEYHNNYEEDEVDHHHVHPDPVTSLDLKLAPVFLNLQMLPVGSVNGLVCMWQFGNGLDNTFICNPITREYMIIPRQEDYSGGNVSSVYCFGFGSLTREYKVIRIFEMRKRPSKNILREAEVYTLGTGQWRSLGHVRFKIQAIYGRFLNGHAHWNIADDKYSPKNICAFDFDKETFKLFPSTPCEATERSSHYTSLGVLRGCLCRCVSYDDNLAVWVMKEYGIEKSWHKELVIEKSISPNIETPMYIIQGFKDGTILMASFGKTLLVYCPRRKTIVDTRIFDHIFRGYAYRPSFHRLQNFENERVGVF